MMAEASASGPIRLRESTLIPKGTVFVWLNTRSEDFEKFKRQLCNETSITSYSWKFYNDKVECVTFINETKDKQNIVLISSGRLCGEVIHDLHNLPQIHSIYIYCNIKDKYESLKTNYKKLRGVFDDPVQLYDRMCRNLDEEARQSLSYIPSANSESSAVKTNPVQLHCLFFNELKSFYTPDVPLCPWKKNSCSALLPIKGQGTIAIWSNKRIPFELRLSNKQNPNDNDVNSYTIVLSVDEREARLSTISAQHGHILNVRNKATECHQVLQLDDGHWHCYWLTFYSADRMAQYGIDEIRPKFRILETQLPEYDKTSIKSIAYLHIKINNTTDLNSIENLKDKLRIFIGKEPVIFDPPLLIISPSEFSPTHPANNNCVLASLLENPCRNLYHNAIKFALNDESFPNFIETIESSIRNPNGWCHKKLQEKVHQLGTSKEMTYLSIKVDEFETGNTEHLCFIKIWPPGYYSPVENHGDAYGIIRILHGKLLLKLFSVLSDKLPPNLCIEQLFEENQVTWMMPRLNQTYEIKNPDMYGSCCIIIQCYQYDSDDRVYHDNFIRHIKNRRRSDDRDCNPDGNYVDFKKIIKMESMLETAV